MFKAVSSGCNNSNGFKRRDDGRLVTLSDSPSCFPALTGGTDRAALLGISEFKRPEPPLPKPPPKDDSRFANLGPTPWSLFRFPGRHAPSAIAGKVQMKLGRGLRRIRAMPRNANKVPKTARLDGSGIVPAEKPSGAVP